MWCVTLCRERPEGGRRQPKACKIRLRPHGNDFGISLSLSLSLSTTSLASLSLYLLEIGEWSSTLFRFFSPGTEYVAVRNYYSEGKFNLLNEILL